MKPAMSAASSWMMSEAVPPTKFVSSLSWTEFGSTGTTCTWMSLWLAFHPLTMFLFAATVVGCQTYVENVRLTTLCRFGPACAAPTASAAHSSTAAPRPRNFLMVEPPFLVVAPVRAPRCPERRRIASP